MAAAPVLPASPAPIPESASLSQGARIVNAFIAPSKTFTDLRRNASWWAPWLLISIFSVLFVYAMARQIGFDKISRLKSSALSCHHERPNRGPNERRFCACWGRVQAVRDLLFPSARSSANKSRFLATLVMTTSETE